MYGYSCEYCSGIVREKLVSREAFRHSDGFVILENVPVGVCETCGARYYHANLLRRVAEVATGTVRVEKMEPVPVASFA